ncbi:MAG: hypothetical protein KDA77_03935 [Planctomycetaceae bacterium]|nr:hypothetical protein [Planctomycetaceae bacterium]
MHSHADYLSQCGNSSLLAIHTRIYHGDRSSNPGMLCTPHCHWVCSGIDFDKTVPVKFTEGTTVAANDLDDLPGDHLATSDWGPGLLPLAETVRPDLISNLAQATLTHPKPDFCQLYCTWTC